MPSIKNIFKAPPQPKMTTIGGNAPGIVDDFKTGKVVETIELNAQKTNSTVVITNLNADLLDGSHAAAFQAAGNYITALTGEVTAAGPGSVAATIANDAVTYAKIQNVTAQNRILGRASAGAGDIEEIELSSAGDVTQSQDTLIIGADKVTYQKIQNVSATDKILGRVSAGAGDIEEISTTGSGNVVRATSPTLVTPTLGAASLSNIQFPAVQVASADANNLDDYEEGTWTGTLKGAVDPTTAVTATGTYTKIGRMVYIAIAFLNKDTTGGSGTMYISGLPFTSSATRAVGSVMSYGLAVPNLYNVANVDASSSLIDFFSIANNGAWTQPTLTAGAGKYLYVSITYTV